MQFTRVAVPLTLALAASSCSSPGPLLGADPKPARLWLRRHAAALHRIARI